MTPALPAPPPAPCSPQRGLFSSRHTAPVAALAALKGTLLAILALSCSHRGGAGAGAAPPALAPARAPVVADPAPRPAIHPPTLIRAGTVFTATGTVHRPGFVLLVGGRIVDVGEGAGVAPDGAVVVDVPDGFITPGIIDTHSHMGVYPTPGTDGGADGNEVGASRTADVWSEHGFWPQDASLSQAVQAGVTTVQVLPGSANLIGGRATTFKLRDVGHKDATSARALRFPGAPQGLKMACGQNPKGVYGRNKGGRPFTRMGNIALTRQAFFDASDYKRRWDKYRRDLQAWERRQQAKSEGGSPAPTGDKPAGPAKADDPPDPPARDLGHETLAAVLAGEILVHNHCYRADEMHLMLDLAREFGFTIRSFHHAVEAYKLAPRLAEEGVSVSTWVDWWGFKMESYDAVRENVALLHHAGVRAIVHSDSPVEIRQLNQEAAKAQAAGLRLGIAISDDAAIAFITKNPAWALGVDAQTGTLETNKMADVVVWDAHPLSTYAAPRHVFIDGVEVYARARAPTPDQTPDIRIGTAPLATVPLAPAPLATTQAPAPAPASAPTPPAAATPAREVR